MIQAMGMQGGVNDHMSAVSHKGFALLPRLFGDNRHTHHNISLHGQVWSGSLVEIEGQDIGGIVALTKITVQFTPFPGTTKSHGQFTRRHRMGSCQHGQCRFDPASDLRARRQRFST